MRGPVAFGYPRIVRLAPLAMLILMLGGFALALSDDTAHRDGPILLGAAAVALTIALVLRTRVELATDEITVVTPWRSRRFQRAEINAVNWERGSNVVLELRTGRNVSLPSVAGHDAEMTGAIHAWLQEGPTR